MKIANAQNTLRNIDIAAAPPHEDNEDERGSKEGAGDQGVGNGIEPDQFRLPLKARAMRE